METRSKLVRSSNVDIACFELITSYVAMPDENKDPTDDVMARKERNFSPSQSRSERETRHVSDARRSPLKGRSIARC